MCAVVLAWARLSEFCGGIAQDNLADPGALSSFAGVQSLFTVGHSFARLACSDAVRRFFVGRASSHERRGMGGTPMPRVTAGEAGGNLLIFNLPLGVLPLRQVPPSTMLNLSARDNVFYRMTRGGSSSVSVQVVPPGVHRQMANQRVRMGDSFPRISSMGGVIILPLLVSFSLVSAGETFGDPDAVRVKRIRTPTYVSLVLENRRAYDVTATLTIRPENGPVTRLVPETTTYGGYVQVEAARISAADPGKPYRWRHNFRWAKAQ